MVILRNSNFTSLSVILHTLYENANKQLTYRSKKTIRNTVPEYNINIDGL